MSARVLAVWCPDWPAVAAAGESGWGPHLPVAVLGSGGVVACNAPARAAGVRRGLRRREAQFRCPELMAAAADEGRDTACFEPVVRALDAMVPGIELLRPGLVVCSAAGALRFHGGVEPLVTGVVDAVAGAGAECRVGLADQLPTAVLAARHGRCLEPGGDADHLAGLPISALLLEPALGGDRSELGELVTLLRRLGVHTLGDFARLPAREVTTRFGESAAVAHRVARAVPWRPPSVSALPAAAVIRHHCDPPVDRVDVAAFLARRLADELHRALAAAGAACLRLAIRARFDGGGQAERTWRCATPLTPDATADRMRWQLEGWLATGGGAVITELELEPVEVAPAGRLQEALWGATGLAEERVHRALTRVQGLLGPDAVRTPVLVGGRGPAERVLSVAYGERAPEPVSTGPWPGSLPAPSPSVVWPGSGYRLEVTGPGGRTARVPVSAGVRLCADSGDPVGVGERGLLTGDPARVELGGRWCPVGGWTPPWPVDEGWWAAAEAVPRARMQLVVQGAPALLLSCPMGGEPGRWTVEGVYE